VKEAFMMATEVVMIFPAVMDVEARRIAAATAPAVRRVSVGRIARVPVAAPTAAAVKTSAERAGAYDQDDERLN
jgi:hypothetical protein